MHFWLSVSSIAVFLLQFIYLTVFLFLLLLQNYSGQGGSSGNGGGAGDEDYEIPPITPPNHPEPPLLHLMDPESSYLCHSLPHNGLINPYSYPELPALMMSNMLAQDGHLLSSQMPSVSYHRRVSGDGRGKEGGNER